MHDVTTRGSFGKVVPRILNDARIEVLLMGYFVYEDR